MLIFWLKMIWLTAWHKNTVLIIGCFRFIYFKNLYDQNLPVSQTVLALQLVLHVTADMKKLLHQSLCLHLVSVRMRPKREMQHYIAVNYTCILWNRNDLALTTASCTIPPNCFWWMVYYCATISSLSKYIKGRCLHDPLVPVLRSALTAAPHSCCHYFLVKWNS